MSRKQSTTVTRQVSRTKKTAVQVDGNGTTAYVLDPKQLPIALPRVAPGSSTILETPEWLQEAPKGAFFSPILLVRAGFYKSPISAQVALRKWAERGVLEHPSRGVYRKVE